MTKPHIKVIQRNGVDIFVTSSMKMKARNIKKVKPRCRCRSGEELIRFTLQPYFLPPLAGKMYKRIELI